MPPVKKITAWSFSRYSLYKLCPFKLKLTAIDKLKEPPNQAMARGSHIHELAEQYIKGQLAKPPVELKKFFPLFKELRTTFKKKTVINCVEESWAFTKDWAITRWDDWAECWVRIKLDHAMSLDHEVLTITDWKTGKFKPQSNEDYLEQLELYALAGLLRHPTIKEARPRLVYLDEGVTYPDPATPLIYTQADVPRLKALWQKRTKAMLADTKFSPQPNWSCRFCQFQKASGGPCQY